MKVLRWSILYWLGCSFVIVMLTYDMPATILMPHLVIYALGGVGLYAIGMFVFILMPFQIKKREGRKERKQREQEECKREFEKVQYLKQKYRTMKLEELVADHGIDVCDKALLLEYVYGYSPQKVKDLLKDSSAVKQ